MDRKTGAKQPYITLANIKGIVQFAQIAVLEVHPWGSRNETMEQADRIIIDLDPDAAIDWKTLAASAQEVRKRLQKLGLKSFVKTTGGKGLHVVVPIRPEHGWPEVKKFTHEFVRSMEKDAPRLFLTTMSKAARVGKDLSRLSAQRSRIDGGGAVFSASAGGVAGGGAVELERIGGEGVDAIPRFRHPSMEEAAGPRSLERDAGG